MVVLGSHDASLPGRYWGEGQEPVASPSQASLLLARLNERARARKAGLGKGTPRDGQKGLGTEITTPEQRLTRGDREEGISGIVATPKTQHISTTQPSSDVQPKVNGVKVSDPFSEEAESVGEKKRKKGEETDDLTGGGSMLEISMSEQNEECVEGSVTKKKKKKRKREEEERAVRMEGLVSSQDEGGSEAPITKKKKKKRKKEEEELLQGGEEGEAIEPVISEVAVEGAEESGLKKKKKKKKQEEYMNENESGTVDESRSAIKKAKKNENEDNEMEDSRTEESITKSPQTKKEKKKKGEELEEEEEVEKTVKRKMKEEEINDTEQQETNETLHSPAHQKKKKKKNIKLEPKEDENQDTSTTLKVPKIRVKEEILDRNEAFEMEQKEEEEELGVDNHIGGGDEEKEEENEKDRQDDETKKIKKREKKKKKTKKKEGKEKNREVKGFTLLTEVEATRKQKVQRTLPHWLAHPTVIGRDLMADGTPVDSLPGLDPSLKDLLKLQKVQQLFPVQRAVIPEILAGAGTLACRFRPRDLCVSAPTGSGKTLAYVLPLVQALRSRTVPRIRALILLPVQELATQVFHVFQTYCRGTPLRVGKAVGHSTLQKEQTALVAHHLDRHHSLVDILVATPGRLADHLRMTRGLDLSALRYLVLDEADRMLAAEGGDWVAHVQRAISDHQAVSRAGQSLPQAHLQRLLFSATLSSDPEQLQHVTLHHPKLFTVAAPAAGQDKSAAVVIGQFVRPSELKEEYVMVEEEVKPLALHHLLVSGEGRHRVLVFTNSVHATHKLALLLAALSRGSERVVAEFSSKRDKRQQIVSQFASGKIDVLVSSDAMARGLDIPNIDHVVSYDVTATTTYVHRIGRTARAGRPGTALSIVTKSSIGEFRKALSGGGEGASQLSLAPEELEPYEQQYIDALASLKGTLEEEEREKRQNHTTNGKAKKKQKKKKRQRKQKKDLRTTRLAQRKAGNSRGKVTVNANRLRHHPKRT